MDFKSDDLETSVLSPDEQLTEYSEKTSNKVTKDLYIKVQNLIRDVKIRKYVKESSTISSEKITFWGGFTGKNALQIEKIKNVKLRIELLQSKKIEEKDKYESKDIMSDLYACAISELSGNFTEEMKSMYNTIKKEYAENISDEVVYDLACQKITNGQSFLPIIHEEKTKGIFGDTKTQIEFYKIENKRLENQIILARGKSQFGTFSYNGKDAGVIIPTNIKITKNA